MNRCRSAEAAPLRAVRARIQSSRKRARSRRSLWPATCCVSRSPSCATGRRTRPSCCAARERRRTRRRAERARTSERESTARDRGRDHRFGRDRVLPWLPARGKPPDRLVGPTPARQRVPSRRSAGRRARARMEGWRVLVRGDRRRDQILRSATLRCRRGVGTAVREVRCRLEGHHGRRAYRSGPCPACPRGTGLRFALAGRDSAAKSTRRPVGMESSATV
jgi:hypothetical protein